MPASQPPKNLSKKQPFLSDIQEIRKRARSHIEQGAITPSYHAQKETVIRLLNEALATEIVCTLRYKHHFVTAQGLASYSIAQEFRVHAHEEQRHADRIAQRIQQIGGNPNFNPEGLAARSHAEYVESTSLEEMIREDLIAERIAIESYREIIDFLGEQDPTTRRLMEDILAKEEEHAEDMSRLLLQLHQQKGLHRAA